MLPARARYSPPTPCSPGHLLAGPISAAQILLFLAVGGPATATFPCRAPGGITSSLHLPASAAASPHRWPPPRGVSEQLCCCARALVQASAAAGELQASGTSVHRHRRAPSRAGAAADESRRERTPSALPAPEEEHHWSVNEGES